MKPKLKFLLVPILAWIGFFSLPVYQAGCQHQVTLETGGVYSDPVLATTDQAILDSSRALTAFVEWANANATYLARWPEIGQLAIRVATQKDGWIRDAYAARDAYAQAAKDYKDGKAGSPDPQRAKLNGILALIKSATDQIINYRNAHSNV